MAQAERVDVLVLGSGTGGKVLAWHMAGTGHRTVVVERRWVGGSCPNVNCLPSKNVVKSAEVADVVRHARAFGTVVTGARTDMAAVVARKRKMVDGRFGSRVTVVERGPHLLGREGPDVGEALQRLFADEEIDVVLNAEALRVDGRPGALQLVVRTKGGERVVAASDLLAAAGRVPNTAGIGLDVAGVELDERGYIAVNDRLETSAPGVWAIGECAGSPQFTHVSENDAHVIRDNLEGKPRSTRGRLVPSCVFTDPPLAHVGLSEIDARRLGLPVRVVTMPMQEVLRTRSTGETRGFMKALIEEGGDQILGFTTFGADAGEVMSVVQTAMLARLPSTGMREAMFAHPTMAEGLGDLFARVKN